MKTLIISSCTKDKIYNVNNQLSKEDFIDLDLITQKEKRLEQFRTKAKDIYKGRQHVKVMEGIQHLRDKFGKDVVDLAIISAGYGLLDEDDEIVPYNVTFSEMKKDEVIAWSNHLKINENTSKLIQSYDLVLFLLGEEYLRSLCLPFIKTRDDQKLIFLSGKASKKLIPDHRPYYFVEVRHQDAKEFGEMSISIKGHLFKLLAQEVAINGINTLEDVYKEPEQLLQLLDRYRQPEIEQLSLFEEEVTKTTKNKVNREDSKAKPPVIHIPQIQNAKNYGFHEMKYFMPENNDRVDPNFNFITEEHTKDRDPFMDDVYAHEIYGVPNYDGVLISKVNIDESEMRKQRILEVGGLRNFLRLPANIPLYGDCGAFSYINKDKPPYQTEEILQYYSDFQFDIGVSIDHLVIGHIAQDVAKRNYRFDLTLENAKDFLVKHQSGGYQFKPSGIAQGWDPSSYHEAVKQLVEMGYRHISLGGLAYAKSEQILDVLIEVAPLLPEYMEVHLFGAARLELLQTYYQLGVTSFDSTAFLKKAWGGASGGNYFTKDQEKYAAVRIPQANTSKNPKLKELVARDIGEISYFEDMEKKALNYLRSYADGNVSMEETIEAVIRYDSHYETLKEYKKLYKGQVEKRNKHIVANLKVTSQELENIAWKIAKGTTSKAAVNTAETILAKSATWTPSKILGWVEEQIEKQMRTIHKKEELSQFEEYSWGDVSFHKFLFENIAVVEKYIEDPFLRIMKDIAALEVEVIEKEALTLLSSTLKEYFTENYETVCANNKLRPHYLRVLADQPWKKCNCEICRGIGVEVIIFRGNNRNRRRGFHNTHVFYEQFKEIMQNTKVTQ
ncbi:tRNA-guanine transglycosylase DpdA [Ectobacillus funiculus]|uniref:tRNA-guanine transglycosylase DpdA n=1 Tax=Ectobacillus funiculus TaxID=137993 RepID=UPI00101C221D|nr:tRNA-guanine transglycosylase DpdA [Ectobacillus funiculus]